VNIPHLTKQYKDGLLSKQEYTTRLERRYKVYWAILGIHRTMANPGARRLTSAQINSYVTAIKLGGGKVKPEYE